MKKNVLIVISIITAFVFILFINEFIKAGAIYLMYTKDISFVINGISLSSVFILPENHNLYKDLIIYLLPVFSVIIFIELSGVLLSKIYNNNIRTGLIVFQIMNIGYLVIMMLINAVSVLVYQFISTDWLTFIEVSKFSTTKGLLITFLLIAVIFTYINFTSNRIRKYITFIKA